MNLVEGQSPLLRCRSATEYSRPPPLVSSSAHGLLFYEVFFSGGNHKAGLLRDSLLAT